MTDTFEKMTHMLKIGTLDWAWYADRIKACEFRGPLTLELSAANSDAYRNMGFETLARTAWERIDKIRNLME